MSRDWVRIGLVRSVNPTRRELRIAPDTEHGHALKGLAWLHIRPRGGEMKRCKTESLRQMGENWRAIVSPGVPRDVIGTLTGATVLLPEAEYRPEERDLRPRDLVGMQVLDADGELLGSVVEVYEGAANAAFTVEKVSGGTLAIPVIDEVFLNIDPDRREVTLGDIRPYAVDSDAD